MKVNIYQTVEVSDEDRKLIATALGQKTASREELKDWIWKYGSRWQDYLVTPSDVIEPDPLDNGDDEDLLGLGDSADEEDLI